MPIVAQTLSRFNDPKTAVGATTSDGIHDPGPAMGLPTRALNEESTSISLVNARAGEAHVDVQVVSDGVVDRPSSLQDLAIPSNSRLSCRRVSTGSRVTPTPRSSSRRTSRSTPSRRSTRSVMRPRSGYSDALSTVPPVTARIAIAVVIIAVAGGIAWWLEHRRVAAPPTQGRAVVPQQLDRRDFPRPARCVSCCFTSQHCDSCAGLIDKAKPLESDDVSVTEVEYGAQPSCIAGTRSKPRRSRCWPTRPA